MESGDTRDIYILFLRTIWLFQALLAGPIFVFLGIYTFVALYEPIDTIYNFVRNLLGALMAGSVVLIVLVQRKVPTTPKKLTRNCELAKSNIATAFWMWWLLDAALCDSRYGFGTKSLVVATAIAVILLFILFYPPLVFAVAMLENDEEGQIRLAEDADAREAGYGMVSEDVGEGNVVETP